MIGNNRISAVLVSTDLETSQDFYQNKVGLTLSPETIKNHLLFDCGNGTTLLIYGRGSGNSADHRHGYIHDGGPRRDFARHWPVSLVQGPGRQHHRYLSTRVISGAGVRRGTHSAPAETRVCWCKRPHIDQVDLSRT